MVIKINKLLFLSVIAGSFLVSTSTIKCMVTPVGPVLSNSNFILNTARGITSKSISGVIGLGKYALKRYRFSGCKSELEYIKRLLKYGYKEEAKKIINRVNNKYSCTLLHMACSNSPVKIVKLLLPNCTKETINTVDKDGETPLYAACSDDSVEKVKLLLPKCTEETINRANNNDRTALCTPCFNGSVEIVKLLLPKCTEKTINKADKDKITPLNWACWRDSVEVVKLLLQNNVNIDAKSQEEVINKLNLKKYLDAVLAYNKSTNKVKYIFDLKEDKNIEMHEFLVKVAFGKALQIEQDLAIFFKLYNMGKSEVEWEKIFGVKYKLDMFEFIKEVFRDKDENYFINDEFLFIKLEEMFKFKSMMNKTRNNDKFTDCAIKFSENEEKTEKKVDLVDVKKILKLKRKELRQLIEDLSTQEKFLKLLQNNFEYNKSIEISEKIIKEDVEEISKVKLKIGQLERNIETVKKELSLLEKMQIN